MLSQPYSAFNLTTFPRTCATTCQPYCSYRDQPVVTAGSEITSLRPVVLTGWLPSLSTPSALRSISLPFQLRALHEPRHLSVGHRCHHRYGLLATHLAIVYSVYSAYLPGLPLRVPRRLRKVTESNRLLIRGFLMSPPRGRTAVAFLRTVFILFHLCRFAPVIPAFSLPCLMTKPSPP